MKKFVEWLKDFWEFNMVWNHRHFVGSIKNRFIRRHYLIKTGLKKGQWYDTDIRMLYGMMNLLVEYIDRERPLERIDWDADDFHKEIRDEFVVIRKWWDNYNSRCKIIKKAMDDWHDERFKDCPDGNNLEWLNTPETNEARELADRFHKMEQEFEDEETDMLIRLIKIRKCLWT